MTKNVDEGIQQLASDLELAAEQGLNTLVVQMLSTANKEVLYRLLLQVLADGAELHKANE